LKCQYSNEPIEKLPTEGHSLKFQRNKSTVNEQKVEILILNSIENFRPERQPNSEQNVEACSSAQLALTRDTFLKSVTSESLK
jgi:hypothetical protein